MLDYATYLDPASYKCPSAMRFHIVNQTDEFGSPLLEEEQTRTCTWNQTWEPEEVTSYLINALAHASIII